MASVRYTVGGLIPWTPHQRVSRAIVKTIIYRAVMVLSTTPVALSITVTRSEALSIEAVVNVIKTATDFGYGRIWDRITSGLAH